MSCEDNIEWKKFLKLHGLLTTRLEMSWESALSIMVLKANYMEAHIVLGQERGKLSTYKHAPGLSRIGKLNITQHGLSASAFG